MLEDEEPQQLPSRETESPQGADLARAQLGEEQEVRDIADGGGEYRDGGREDCHGPPSCRHERIQLEAFEPSLSVADGTSLGTENLDHGLADSFMRARFEVVVEVQRPYPVVIEEDVGALNKAVQVGEDEPPLSWIVRREEINDLDDSHAQPPDAHLGDKGAADLSVGANEGGVYDDGERAR